MSQARRNKSPKSAGHGQGGDLGPPFTGWESCEHYLGISRGNFHTIGGYGGERLPFDQSGFPDWANYRIGLNVTDYYSGTFARYILQLPKKPDGLFWVTMTQFKEYLEFRRQHSADYLAYTRNRRARLGDRWDLNWFQLNEQEKFILRMPKHSFLEHFQPDPRGSVLYSKLQEGAHLWAPILLKKPEGFPSENTDGCDINPMSHPHL